MATKKSERIAVAAIAIIMTFGTLGTYVAIIWQNNNAQADQATAQTEAQKQYPVDPTAYTVKDRVNSLQVQDLKVGDGAEAKAGDTVKVHYKGTIAQTGVKFDSSYDRGEPVTLSLGNVIPGWQQGIPGMKVGGKRRLLIPAALAYGSQAQPGIPADSDLVFEIELFAVNPAQ